MRYAKKRFARAFTLIEAAVATAIVGVGVTALVTALGSGTKINDSGRKLTLAVNLAQEIREWTVRLDYVDPQNPQASPGSDEGNPQAFVDDLDDLVDVTFSPPRDGQGSAIADMAGWSQHITITYRDVDNLQSIVVGRTDVAHVQLDVTCNSKPILTTGWLVTRR